MTRKSKAWMTLACLIALPAGSCSQPVPPIDGPLFCDVEEPRVFPSTEVVQWRIANDRDNLIRDVRTNETFEASCD